MNYQIGQTVQLNGKDYKIIGTRARSFILERDGKQYKATPDKLSKIQTQNADREAARQSIVDDMRAPEHSSALSRRLSYERLWNPNAQFPKTEAEILDWFEQLRSDLSPENLCCDGELTRTQVNSKLKEINACWSELEVKLGRRVAK